jgi:hypothetical protein
MTINILRRVTSVETRLWGRSKRAVALSVLLMIGLGAGAPAVAQEGAAARVAGTFNDHIWVEMGSGAGAWQVGGEWTAQLNRQGTKADFIGSLLGVRSDLWVLQTNADPTSPAVRTPHTHHVGLLNADIAVIPNGIRLTGAAIITTNGSVAPFSGSPVQVDITGGALIRFSNIKLTFLGPAVEHFGSQAYDGIVAFGR